MKLLKLAVLSSAIVTSGAVFADSQIVRSGETFQANQLIPTGVRAEVGTTGYGGALLWTANPYVGLALGYNGGDISWRDDLSVNGTKYDMEMDNKTAYLNAEIRPWGASDNAFAQGLYVAAGVAYIDNSYDLQKRINGSNDTIKIDGENYYSPNGQGSVRGKMDYKDDIAPYLGFGIAPKINKNWGVFGEIGAYYTGNPNVSLKATDLVKVGTGTATNPIPVTGQDAADREANKIRNDDKYEWMPVGKVGVSFHW